MALSQTASSFDGFSASLASFGKSLAAFFEEVGRARAARALYSEFSAMSDAELDKFGMKRDDIAGTVYSKVYDLR